MNIDELNLLLLDWLPEDVILPAIPDPTALIGSAKIEDGLPNKQLLGERIVDPFLYLKSPTSISWWRIVFIGE
jgi:hypothetical protein